MRTLNSNQITESPKNSKMYVWNQKKTFQIVNNHSSILKLTIMRTLNSNQITESPKNSKTYAWNLKRRFR
jgi:hypothetical protein